MTDAAIVRKMREFQSSLLAMEQAQFEEMARRWLDVERSLEAQMNALAMEIDAARQAGKPITQGQARGLERLQSLLAQTENEIAKYAEYAAELIGERQAALSEQGWHDALEAMRAAGSGVPVPGFDMLPVGAFQNAVGLMADGSPLLVYLQGAFGDAATGMVRMLLLGVAQGWNPTRTARAMRDGLGIGLQRALNTARTEQLRVYREAMRAGYEQSGMVLKYKRMASKSVRTCIACLVADGRIYDVATAFEEHNQGRCTLVPVLVGQPEPKWETGLQWFEMQSVADQQEILGKEYYKAWKAGAFTLEDLATRHEDPVWGASLRVTPLGDLVEKL